MNWETVQTYGTVARKAAREPRKAVYKARELLATPPANAHTRVRTSTLPSQYDRLEALRQGEEYLLIVLDACRYDALAAVGPEYLSFETLEPIRSEGLNTFEYAARCWPETYEDVTYVSAATPVNSDSRSAYDEAVLSRRYDGYVPAEHIETIRDVWRESWDESIGITPPEPVTDAALESEGSTVAHYFQPHAPYVGRQPLLGHTNDEDSRPNEGEPVDAPVWQRVRYGTVSRSELRRAYVSNLRRALRTVRRLVEETTAETVVVMGDHGEALGEYGIYGHPSVEHPHIRTVPWGVVDEVRYAPGGGDTETADSTVEKRLEDLGYLG